MIMQDREVFTEYALQTKNLGHNTPSDSEFGMKIMLKNQLSDCLRSMDKTNTFKINLLISAKDDNESVLAEKWQFLVNLKQTDDLLESMKSDDKQKNFMGQSNLHFDDFNLILLEKNVSKMKQQLKVVFRGLKSLLLTLPMTNALR
tara:strand:- start:1772 stop:2209 length:438 start_codon:yes stop_codon:yes gene_type:complete